MRYDREQSRIVAMLRKITGFVAIAFLASSLVFVGCSDFSPKSKRSIKMSMSADENPENLSADLVPFISNPNASAVLVKIAEVRLEKQVERDLEMEVGRATFNVVEAIYSNSLAAGNSIAVPVKRVADPRIRVRNNINQWNNLALQQGDLLLLLCRVLTAPKVWQGLAARRVESSSSTDVVALRQCYVIEKFTGPHKKKREMIEDAMTSQEDLLLYYALDSIGRRATFGSETGAEIIYNAIMSPKTPTNNKVELASYLTRDFFFDADRKLERPNQTVVTALAKGLVSETDAERRLTWAKYLASVVLSEFSPNKATDRATRLSLIRAIRTPPPNLVINVLSNLSKQGEEDERGTIKELLDVWRDAGTATP